MILFTGKRNKACMKETRKAAHAYFHIPKQLQDMLCLCYGIALILKSLFQPEGSADAAVCLQNSFP